MKKSLLIIILVFASFYSNAQQELTFPFQGGSAIYNRFFKDSLVVSPEIIQKHATGTVIFKFTADDKGAIEKIIICYADDYVLTTPFIEALKKSNHQWIIPDNEKFHDFIITFSVNFNPPTGTQINPGKDAYNFYLNRRPIVTNNQVPLDNATLLPTVVVHYDLP